MGAVGLALLALSPLPREAVGASQSVGACAQGGAHPTHSSLLPEVTPLVRCAASTEHSAASLAESQERSASWDQCCQPSGPVQTCHFPEAAVVGRGLVGRSQPGIVGTGTARREVGLAAPAELSPPVHPCVPPQRASCTA
eukprot:2472925-Amphidinium_carterae.1